MGTNEVNGKPIVNYWTLPAQSPANSEGQQSNDIKVPLRPKEQETTDTVNVTGNQPTEEQKAEKLKRRQKETEEAINAKKKAETFIEYEKKLAEYRKANADYNKAYKKRLSLTKEQKAKRAADRAKADQNLENLKKELVEARQKYEAAVAKVGDDKANRAANAYIRELAQTYDNEKKHENKDRVASLIAAEIEAKEFVQSKDGREAIKNEYKDVLAKEKKEAVKQLRKDFEVKILDKNGKETGKTKTISKHYAKTMYNRMNKNLKAMEYQEALGAGLNDDDPVIYIGDKKAYKDAVAKMNTFDENKPQITRMNKDTYAAARRIAASEGLDLPENAAFLNKKQALALQKIMIAAAGAMGSRGDLNESKGIAKEFRGVSAHDVRKLMDATNVKNQKDYSGAAAVGGALVTAGQSTFGRGVTKVVKKIVEKAAGGGQLIDDTIDNTGHGKGQGVTLKSLLDVKNFDWLKGLLNAAEGFAVEELLRRILNNDPNIFRKGKNPADAIYTELDGLKAFKKYTPNAKVILANVLGDKDLTPEEKIAFMQEAMGSGGPKLNGRELEGVYIGLKAHKAKKGPKLQATEDDVKQSERNVYKLKDNAFVDKNNKQVNIEDLRDEYGNKLEIKANGTLGIAVDREVAARSGKKGHSDNYQITVNPNNPTDLSQIIISNDDGEVMNIQANDITNPDRFTLTDDSNGKEHVNSYTFKKLTDVEVRDNNLDPQKGPYQVLVEALGPDGNNIRNHQSVGKVFRYHYTQEKPKEINAHIVKDGEIVEDVKLIVNSPEYRLDAVTKVGTSSPVYIETGAHPKGVRAQNTPARPETKPEQKPQPKQEPKQEAKLQPKQEPKQEAKPQPNPEAKPQNPEAKPQNPEAKPQNPEAKPQPNPEAKPEKPLRDIHISSTGHRDPNYLGAFHPWSSYTSTADRIIDQLKYDAKINLTDAQQQALKRCKTEQEMKEYLKTLGYNLR